MRLSITNSIPLPVVNLSASIAKTRPLIISVASTSITVPSRCSVSILIVREFGLLVVSMLISTTWLAAVPLRSPSCSILTKAPAWSVAASSWMCNPVPVVRVSNNSSIPLPDVSLSASIARTRPVVISVASTSTTVPSRCSVSILIVREFGLLVVSMLISTT